MMGFRITQVFFWLALALYFGGLATLGPLVAYELFTTIPETHVQVPSMSPKLNQPRELAGDVFGNILQKFNMVELICLPILFATVAIQTAVYLNWLNPWSWLRLILVGVLLVVALYDIFYTGPQVRRQHTLWVQNVDRDPAMAHSHELKFDKFHSESERNGVIKLIVLLALLAVTAAGVQGPQRGIGKTVSAPPKSGS